MVRCAIEIQKYGDFDMRYTDTIMISDNDHSVKTLKKSFCDQHQIDLSNLPHGKINYYADEFIKFLKERGFKPLKTKEIIFGS